MHTSNGGFLMAKAVRAIVDGIDITIPKALRAPKKTPEEREALIRLIRTEGTAQRHWVMPDPNAPKPAPDKVFVYDDKLPVQVNVRVRKGPPVSLATYENLAEFESKHDRASYPVVQTASDKDQTIILVSAKPWAKAHLPAEVAPMPHQKQPLATKILGEFGPALGKTVQAGMLTEKGAKLLAHLKTTVDTPPTKAQAGPKPKVGDAWADTILKACENGAGRNAVIDHLCAVYPRESRKTFDNVMYGTLERMVAAGKLTKSKEGKVVLYRPK